jgi:hypothetical protein
MNATLTGGLCAAVVAFGMAASAQTSGQTQPSTGGTAQQTASSMGEQVTVTGCVQREADFRRSQGAGGGGVAGTGVGAGNELVLTDVSTSGTTSAGSTTTPTGTTGTSGARGNAYELTGPNEGQVQQYVGRRVEIAGKLKPAEVGATGPTGGPTAGAPPAGVDVTSKDLKLRELEVTSVKEASGSCPTAPR